VAKTWLNSPEKIGDGFETARGEKGTVTPVENGCALFDPKKSDDIRRKSEVYLT